MVFKVNILMPYWQPYKNIYYELGRTQIILLGLSQQQQQFFVVAILIFKILYESIFISGCSVSLSESRFTAFKQWMEK
jgi:hypothetical protein